MSFFFAFLQPGNAVPWLLWGWAALLGLRVVNGVIARRSLEGAFAPGAFVAAAVFVGYIGSQGEQSSGRGFDALVVTTFMVVVSAIVLGRDYFLHATKFGEAVTTIMVWAAALLLAGEFISSIGLRFAASNMGLARRMLYIGDLLQHVALGPATVAALVLLAWMVLGVIAAFGSSAKRDMRRRLANWPGARHVEVPDGTAVLPTPHQQRADFRKWEDEH